MTKTNDRTRPALLATAVLSGLGLLLGACAAPGAKDRREQGYDIFAQIDAAPGNITVTPDDRVIVSLHQFYEPRWRVAEVDPDTGVLRPFPTGEWAEELGADGIGLDAVLGIRTDDEGIVWMLDNGGRLGSTPRLIGWNTETDALHRVIAIPNPPGVARTFLNDFAIDPIEQHVYIADVGGDTEPAIVVVDLVTGLSRRVLEGDPVVSPEPGADLFVDNDGVRMATPEGGSEPAQIGVNPIAIDAKAEWVYFGSMNGETLYRVRAEDLRDASLTRASLSARVERYADKPVSDGITIDTKGNIYVTDLNAGGIGVIDRNRRYERLFDDPEIVSWPDGMSGGPDGLIYVTVNQLHKSAPLNGGLMRAFRPT
jgi:sugar lactone lactonase YvrE